MYFGLPVLLACMDVNLHNSNLVSVCNVQKSIICAPYYTSSFKQPPKSKGLISYKDALQQFKYLHGHTTDQNRAEFQDHDYHG